MGMLTQATLTSSLASSLGLVEVGIVISIFLYGISVAQAYVYYQYDFKDGIWLRTLVSYCTFDIR